MHKATMNAQAARLFSRQTARGKMRKAFGVFFSSIFLLFVVASLAMADTVSVTRHESGFPSDDSLAWAELGVNNLYVANGTTANTANGIATTITFATGGTGATQLQCPATNCTWNGNFAPSVSVLTDLNFSTGGDSGAITLSFGKGVSDVGFQLEPYLEPAPGQILDFNAEIGVYIDGVLSDTFIEGGTEEYRSDDNTAGFYGIEDATGADITGIKLLAVNCGGAGVNCDGFAINKLLVQDVPAVTPEPSSLFLLGSGLTAIGFLRRKLFSRS